jgi:hypothetical protein
MTLDGQQVENTLWFEKGTTPAVPDMTTLANALLDWWRVSYAPLVSVGLQLREVVVTSQDSSTAPQVTLVPPIVSLGLKNDEIMPNNVTLVVSFRTDLRGRSFRGRNYVTGLTVSSLTGNLIVASDVDAWIGAYNEINTVLGDTVYTWVVCSRFSGVDAAGHPIPRAAGVTTPITAVTIVDNVADSQRRRLPGRGR